MGRPLHVLIAEDSENDAFLMVRELERGGYQPDCERVDTAEAFGRALARAQWDVVLADYNMPRFSALEALSVLRETGLDLPFIIVSGSIGEEVAIETMRAGAHDYIMKNSLTRLPAAVEREIRQAEGRRLKRKAEMALKETNQTLWSLIKSSPLAIVTIDLNRNVTTWNPAAERLFGWSEREVLGATVPIVPKDKHPEFRELYGRALEGKPTTVFETQRKRKDGSLVDVSMTTAALYDSGGKVTGALALFADVTERKRAEKATQDVENRNRAILKSALDGIITIDYHGRIVEFNPAAERIFGFKREKVIGREMAELIIPPSLRQTHREGLRRFVATGKEKAMGRRLELTALRADGTEFPVELSIQRIPLGEPPLFTGFIRDISERKRAEEALKSAEGRYRSIFENALEGIFVSTPDGLVLTANPALAKMLGYSGPEELLASLRDVGRQLYARPERRGELLRLLREKGAVRGFESELLRKDGQRIWVSANVRAALDERGELARLEGVVENITERRHAEEALRESEVKFRALAETTAASIFIYQGTRMRYVNAAAERLTGYSREEFLQMDFWDIIHPEFRDVVKKRGMARQAGEAVPLRYEVKLLTKTGEARWVDFTAGLITFEGSTAVLGTAIDVTERKEAEEALKKSRLLLAKTQEMAHLGGWELDLSNLEDLNKNELRWTEEAFRIFGFKPGEVEVTNELFFQLVHPEDRLKIAEAVSRALREKTSYGIEHRILLPNGNERIVYEHADILFDEATGRPLRMYGSVQDITDRKRGEQALRESEERFRQIAETIKEVFWLTNPVKNEMIYISPGYEEIWGRSRESLYQNPLSWVDAVHPEDRQRVLEATMTKQAKGEFDEEYRIVRPDGQVRWIRDRAYPILNEKGEAYRIAGIAEDVTQEKQLADQLRQMQKIEAVGQLAGGVAHDFNNLLTAIGGYTDFVLEQVPADSPLRKDIEEIKKGTERAAGLTRQLLAFSRRQVMQPVVLNLNELIRSMEGMLRRLIGENIELAITGAPDLAPVKADPHQFEQVIMNLAVNARDAMPKGGRLTIETANMDLDERFVQQHIGAQPGKYAMLAVSDNGCGMDAEVQKHVFEPFFTTKEKGKGTGLGLSTVYGIVKQSGGYISVYSEKGHGSCFKVYLPQVAPPEPAKKASPAHAKSTGGTEIILLVEDEEAVRALTAKILRAKGYTVLEAANGKEAQAVLKAHSGGLDLLLTDVVMPQMGGPELAKWVRSIHRGIKVLFMTGYTDHSAFREGGLPPGTGVMQKPFTPQGLAQSVRAMLDGSKGTPAPSSKPEKQK